MNLYALIIGIFTAVFVVLRFRARKLDKTSWAYPIFLATFPVYYWAFAVYAADYAALVNEVVAGVAFLVVAYVAYRFKSFSTLLLMAMGYVAHGAYDVYHNAFFVNEGAPIWWPEFCGAVDVLIGCYVADLAFASRRQAEFAAWAEK